MGILRTILTIIFVLVCVVSVILVLLQEGKSSLLYKSPSPRHS